MNIVLNKINQILMEKYLKLQDTCRTQVRGAASLAEGEEGALEPGRGGSWAHLEGTKRGGRMALHPQRCHGRAHPTHVPFCFCPAAVAAEGAGEERRARRRRRLHDLHEADCR